MSKMQSSSQSMTSTASKASRNSKMSSIRSSLKSIPLLSKNHNLVLSRFNTVSKKSFNITQSECQSSIGFSTDRILSETSETELFQGTYEILEKLGEGSSGVVYKCLKKETGKIFAAKSFAFEDEHVPSLKSNFLVQKNLKHPSVIRYEALYLDTSKYLGWLVMEYIEWPSLGKANLESEEQIKVVIQQLLEALSYLHKQKIAHRDIKPDNILYDPFSQKIKIIDFGISRRYKRRGHLFDMWTITGTLYYRAPQMFSGGYRQGVDIWAAGVLLYKLVTGKTPFESEYHHETIKNITEADLLFDERFNFFSHELMMLTKRMLTRNVEQRPSAFTLLSDFEFYSIPSHLQQQTGSLRLIQDEQQNHKILPEANNLRAIPQVRRRGSVQYITDPISENKNQAEGVSPFDYDKLIRSYDEISCEVHQSMKKIRDKLSQN